MKKLIILALILVAGIGAKGQSKLFPNYVQGDTTISKTLFYYLLKKERQGIDSASRAIITEVVSGQLTKKLIKRNELANRVILYLNRYTHAQLADNKDFLKLLKEWQDL